jgi:hypothetical protein
MGIRAALMARERAPAGEVVSEQVVFEVDRFEWTEGDRLEVTGRWYGLRGHRFVRPVLIVEADDGPRRMLALLDHKPWAADDGEPWVAAFPWEGDPVAVAGAELAVAPSLAVDLPAPRAPGQRHRKPASATRPARRGAEAAAPAPAAAGGDEELSAMRAQLEGEQQTVRRLAAQLDAAHTRLAALGEASAQRESIQRERDRAVAERDDARARAALARDAVAEERDAAVAARAAAQQERDEALDQRAAAQWEVKAARSERDAAIAERDRAAEAQRVAMHELETLQRRLKNAESQTVAVPAEPPPEPAVRPSARLRRPPREHSPLVVWAQRLAAVIVLIVWAIVVYKVLQGVV